MNLTKNYYTSSNYMGLTNIPSKEDFSKYASNLVTLSDFETDHSNCQQIEKVANAINWTIKNNKKKGNK